MPSPDSRSLRSRLLRAIPKFRSSPSPLAQRGTDGANTPVPQAVPQTDGAEFSAQAPPTIDNAYATIVGSPATMDPTVGSVIYEGLKTVLQGLYDCSDMFLPLKAAAGGLLTIFKIVDVGGSSSKSGS